MLIVTDLDRTLLRADKTISPYTIDVFRRLQQQGKKIAIATARPKRSMEKYIHQINADAAIIHNGAVIYAGGKLHSSFGIPTHGATEILQKIQREYPQMKISVEIDDALYGNFQTPDLEPGLDWTSTLTDFTDLPQKPVDKMLFSAGDPDTPGDPTALDAIRTELSHEYNALIADGWLLMVMNKLACKFLAAKETAAYFGLTTAETIAFGDDFNDMEMLKNCGIGVAVANAYDSVKAIADHVCESNENDGVARWLEEKFL